MFINNLVILYSVPLKLLSAYSTIRAPKLYGFTTFWLLTFLASERNVSKVNLTLIDNHISPAVFRLFPNNGYYQRQIAVKIIK